MMFLNCGVSSLLPTSRPSRVYCPDASAGPSRYSDTSLSKLRPSASSRTACNTSSADSVVLSMTMASSAGTSGDTARDSIPRVSLLYVSQKARETNTLPHALQLMEAALSARLCTRSQEDLQWSVGKHNGPHIPAIRNQTRRSGQLLLPE